MASRMVHVRVDSKVKERAEKALNAMGISVSDAVRVLLVRVAAEQAFPFALEVPNAVTRRALRAAERGRQLKRYRDSRELFAALEK